MKQLEKDIKSLDSSREERINYLERQVEQLKVTATKQQQKVDKQQQKTEQVV